MSARVDANHVQLRANSDHPLSVRFWRKSSLFTKISLERATFDSFELLDNQSCNVCDDGAWVGSNLNLRIELTQLRRADSTCLCKSTTVRVAPRAMSTKVPLMFYKQKHACRTK